MWEMWERSLEVVGIAGRSILLKEIRFFRSPNLQTGKVPVAQLMAFSQDVENRRVAVRGDADSLPVFD